jgi:hypothetical protein
VPATIKNRKDYSFHKKASRPLEIFEISAPVSAYKSMFFPIFTAWTG